MEKINEKDNTSFSFDFISILGWPKLAWVADFPKGEAKIRVRHGSHVEVKDKWCVEGVWESDYEGGGFDRSEFIFGSGIRLRPDRVVFVSASTMLDRLWYVERDNHYFISNSLPALLACSDIDLDDDYPSYVQDMETLTEGIDGYRKEIQAKPCPVLVLYYRNLEYDGKHLIETDKAVTTPDLFTFSDYRNFLRQISEGLGKNLSSSHREFPITPLGCISSGYDSGAATVIAKEAGCRNAVTIENASSFLPRKDSGAEIAKHLGIECEVYRHTYSAYSHEASVWSAAGMPAGLNLTIFRYPEPLCLFFTGYRGDTVWDDFISDDPRHLSGPTISCLGLCEFRLLQGIFHCPVPCWGGMKTRQIQSISRLPEMDNWRLNCFYDRPIPRRILEEASVPRKLFGIRKEATTTDNFFIWPFSGSAMKSFEKFLRSREIYCPPVLFIETIRKTAEYSNLVYTNLPKQLRPKALDPRSLFSIKAQSLLFHWGNCELKEMYSSALK